MPRIFDFLYMFHRQERTPGYSWAYPRLTQSGVTDGSPEPPWPSPGPCLPGDGIRRGWVAVGSAFGVWILALLNRCIQVG